KVGFISSYFRWHSVGRLTVGLLEQLSRRTETTGLQIFIVDTSSSAGEDGDTTTTTEEETSGNDMTTASNDPTKMARETVAALALDVLVFADVGMSALTTALAHSRLAPVQVAFWGHPATTGLRASMDYFVTSDVFEGDYISYGNINHHQNNDQDAGGLSDCRKNLRDDYNLGRQSAFSEQLVRLGGLGIVFDDPAETFSRPNGRAGKHREAEVSSAPQEPSKQERNSHGHRRPRLYICAQSLMKMHPSFDHVIAKVLTGDRLAQIILLRDSRQLLWHARFQRRLRHGTGDGGSLWGRVRFVSPMSASEFFALQCRADVVLDPFPFGGGVTIIEALACGTPVVTAGALQSVHRLAEGMIAVIADMKHLVASSSEEYAEKAIAVAQPGLLRESVVRALSEIEGRDALLRGNGVAEDWEIFLRRATA
ncbi:unnamed protein product, partial [Sphacelaria rigidula]